MPPRRSTRPRGPTPGQLAARLSSQYSRELGLRSPPRVSVSGTVRDFAQRLRGVTLTGKHKRFSAADMERLGETFASGMRGSRSHMERRQRYFMFLWERWGESIPGRVGVPPEPVIAHTIGHVVYERAQRTAKAEPRKDVSQAFGKIYEIEFLLSNDPELAEVRIADAQNNTIMQIPAKFHRGGLNANHLTAFVFENIPNPEHRAELRRQLAFRSFRRFSDVMQFTEEFVENLRRQEK